MRKERNGFTLIELILVLTIIGLLIAIATPNFIAIQEMARHRADVATARGIIDAANLKHISLGLSPEDHIKQNGLTSDYLKGSDIRVQGKHIEQGEKLKNRGTVPRSLPTGKFVLVQLVEGYFDGVYPNLIYKKRYDYAVYWIVSNNRQAYYAGYLVGDNNTNTLKLNDLYWNGNLMSSLWTLGRSYSSSSKSQMYYYIPIQIIE